MLNLLLLLPSSFFAMKELSPLEKGPQEIFNTIVLYITGIDSYIHPQQLLYQDRILQPLRGTSKSLRRLCDKRIQDTTKQTYKDCFSDGFDIHVFLSSRSYFLDTDLTIPHDDYYFEELEKFSHTIHTIDTIVPWITFEECKSKFQNKKFFLQYNDYKKITHLFKKHACQDELLTLLKEQPQINEYDLFIDYVIQRSTIAFNEGLILSKEYYNNMRLWMEKKCIYRVLINKLLKKIMLTQNTNYHPFIYAIDTIIPFDTKDQEGNTLLSTLLKTTDYSDFTIRYIEHIMQLWPIDSDKINVKKFNNNQSYLDLFFNYIEKNHGLSKKQCLLDARYKLEPEDTWYDDRFKEERTQRKKTFINVIKYFTQEYYKRKIKNLIGQELYIINSNQPSLTITFKILKAWQKMLQTIDEEEKKEILENPLHNQTVNTFYDLYDTYQESLKRFIFSNYTIFLPNFIVSTFLKKIFFPLYIIFTNKPIPDQWKILVDRPTVKDLLYHKKLHKEFNQHTLSNSKKSPKKE